MWLRTLSRLHPSKKKLFLINFPWPEMSFALLPNFFLDQKASKKLQYSSRVQQLEDSVKI